MTRNPFDLSGKAAMVTGANTGLGLAIGRALADAGAQVAAVGRRPPPDDAGFHFIEADLGSTEPIDRVVAEAVARLGALDILVNNAGTIRRADAIDVTEEDWDAVIDVNLKGAFFLAQGAARAMLAGGRGGKIINIASMMSFQGGLRVTAYAASKHALAGITKSLANEWAGLGINVNAIAPGYIVTNNTEALRQDADRSRSILERIPAGRWGVPEDIAGAAVFLASRASDYVHGTTLAVDGGWLGR